MFYFLLSGLFLSTALGQLASRCQSILPNSTSVACVNKYAAVMPQPFSRVLSVNDSQLDQDVFRLTSVPSDPSFELVKNSTFIVFNETAGREILGSNPTYELVFETRNDSIHEAPVYIPWQHSIIFSQPHQGIYYQQLINLTTTPPTIRNYTTTPPVYAVNGGKLFDGFVYWAVEGGIPFTNPNNSSETVYQTPGIYKLNPNTTTVEPILNNYFGTEFNSPNDLYVTRSGDVYFTDSWYGYAINVSDPSIQYPNLPLPPATYRFRPSTGQVSIVENTLSQPNGIAFNADESKVYITDTGVTDFSRPPRPPASPLPKYTLNRLGGRAVYAFDTLRTPMNTYELVNKRPVYFPEEFAVDGFHISAAQQQQEGKGGYLVGAAGASVDVISPWGKLLVKITTDFVVNNIQFAGPAQGQTKDLWLFGEGGVAKVRWGLTGTVQE